MNIGDFRLQILSMVSNPDPEARKQSENNFHAFLEQDPCQVLQLLIMNSNSNDQTNYFSTVLLGTPVVSEKIKQIENPEFHRNFQNSLLTLLQNVSLPHNMLSNISFIISKFYKIYSVNWPTLPESLFQIIQKGQSSPFAIECLSHCINNGSISCDNQILQALVPLIQGLFENVHELNVLFLSAVKLVFSLFRYAIVDEQAKQALKGFLVPIVSVNFGNSDLYENFMNEITNFTENNIDFFESVFENLINILCANVLSQQQTEKVENSSILILSYIFCNKKYVNNLSAKSIDFYRMLINLYSSKLPFLIIDPNEGEDANNEPNIFQIIKETLNSLAHYYGGIDEVYENMTNSFYEQNVEDFDSFVSNFMAFGCIVDEIIHLVPDFEDFFSVIIPIYKLGFTNNDMNCRYLSIVSFKKVLKAIPDDYELNANSQDIIQLIFESLTLESVPANITALLSALKACLMKFDDYHDNIGNIIVPLNQNFDNFSPKQQTKIVSIYTCCCMLCKRVNDPFAELMQGIFGRIFSVIREGCSNLSNGFYFTCLDSILSFESFIPDALFNELSMFILNFISSLGDQTTNIIEILGYKQIDIINRTLRRLIRRCPKQQILELSNQVLQPIFLIASTDIIPDRFSIDVVKKNELENNYIVIRCPEENQFICYSKNSIENVEESLNTIRLILEEIPEIKEAYFQPIVNIIEKWINLFFSFDLVLKSVQIFEILLNDQRMKMEETEPFVLGITVKIINSFDIIEEGEESSDDTVKMIQSLNKVLEFIGQNFHSINSLSLIVGSNGNTMNPVDLIFRLYTKWVRIHQMNLQRSNDKNCDDYVNECVNVENKIGLIFEPIFKYFSSPQLGEKLMPLIFQFFPLDNLSFFLTPTFFLAYSSFAVYSSLTNDEQNIKIGTIFSQLLIGGFDPSMPSYVSKKAAESVLLIANSGRIQVDFLLFLIDKIEQAIHINKEKIDNCVVPQLLILIENVAKNEIKLAVDDAQKNELTNRLIVLLLNTFPVNFLEMNNNDYRAAQSLLFLLSLNHPIFNDIRNLAIISSLALLFIIIHKPPDPVLDKLKKFVKSVFTSQNGQVVYNVFCTLPLSARFGGQCVKYIQRITKNQVAVAQS